MKNFRDTHWLLPSKIFLYGLFWYQTLTTQFRKLGTVLSESKGGAYSNANQNEIAKSIDVS